MNNSLSVWKLEFKKALQSMPVLWQVLRKVKGEIKRVYLLADFFYDIKKTYKYMNWSPKDKTPAKLSAELLFQYHKLEKGLVMPGKYRLFGVEPAFEVIKLLTEWRELGFSLADPVFLGALETLHAYAARLDHHDLDSTGHVLPIVQSFLQGYPSRTPELTTPQNFTAIDSFDAFEKIALARRSVREFSQKNVAFSDIAKAVQLAQLSPSACNRQPCKVYVIYDEELKKKALALQNGNRGFGHQIPVLAILVAEGKGFFDATERHQPYVDGGLFAMSFVLGLTSCGIASCFLNWCAPTGNDKRLHAMLNIPTSEYVITMLAIGYNQEKVSVPRSPRRNIADVLHRVD